MWHSRLFWWLFGSFTLLVLAAIALVGVLADQLMEAHEMRQIEASLGTKAILVEEMVRRAPGSDAEALESLVERLRPRMDARITLLAFDGRVVADSDGPPNDMDNHADRPEIVAARHTGVGMAQRHSDTVKQPMMYVARRVEGRSPIVTYVRVGRSLGSIEEQMSALRRLIWAVAGGSALAALLLAFWLARWLVRPLAELTAGAQRIAAGEYGHKVYVVGRGEVSTLARAFNTMSARLAEQFAQVEEDRQQLRAILSGMVEGVVAMDAEQRILFANDRAGELLEFSTQAVVGRKLWEVVRQLPFQEVVQRAVAGSGPHHEELNWSGTASKSLVVHVAQLSGSSARGAVLVLHDTSELRRLERIRQEFVANVSHELKTPLSVIKACVETLIDGAADDTENRGAFLEQIDEQSNRLHLLILDLLALARIESSAEAFEFQVVPLEPLVHDCLDRQRTRAEGKHLRLEAVPPIADRASANGPPVPAALPLAAPASAISAWADEEAIGQILDNLVDNAVKYTPDGGCIRVHWHAQEDHVCLEVTDSGIGIPERDLPRIFERFYRVDKARSREMGGTGLGLSIVKHLVHSMQGSVHATSLLGQGTTFAIRLPRAPQA